MLILPRGYLLHGPRCLYILEKQAKRGLKEVLPFRLCLDGAWNLESNRLHHHLLCDLESKQRHLAAAVGMGSFSKERDAHPHSLILSALAEDPGLFLSLELHSTIATIKILY